MISLGICGCGRFVEQGVLPLVKDVGNVKLAAVFDTRGQRAQQIADEFAIPKVFDNYDELLGCAEIDAVYIATPNSYHKDHTIAAAKAGKHVLCEKPMGRDAAECREMIEACRENRTRLAVGFCYPLGGAQQKAKQLITEGCIGEVSYIHISYNLASYTPENVGWRCDSKISGGGPLMDLAPHLVHLGCFFLDDKAESVMAYVRPEKTESQVETDVNAIIEYSRGSRVVIDASFVRGNPHNYGVVGSEGEIHVLGTMAWRAGGTVTLREEAGEQTVPFGPEEPIAEEFRLFSAAIEGDEELPAPGEIGLHVQAVIDAIYESGRTGKRCIVQS